MERGIGKQDYPWVDLETSLQWRSFKRAVDILRRRGNRVFVVVGPFNEYLLEDASLERYTQIKCQIESWFIESDIPYSASPALPSELYADASHPLSEGYALIARQLLENEFFKLFTSQGEPGERHGRRPTRVVRVMAKCHGLLVLRRLSSMCNATTSATNFSPGITL